jgi:ABC-type sugar transport system substrate-binding protein
MLKRTISLAVVAAAAALWSPGAGAQDQKVYGVLLKTLSNPF